MITVNIFFNIYLFKIIITISIIYNFIRLKYYNIIKKIINKLISYFK